MRLPSPLYRLYERRLASALHGATLPRHIGVMLDGNRRWARSFGETAATGHRRGADKITEFLGWADSLGIEVVTLWMLSTDNLSRSAGELSNLLDIIEDAVSDLAESRPLAPARHRTARPAARPPGLRAARGRRPTAGVKGLQVNVAIGYGGRTEIADAVRSYLTERAKDGATLADLAESIDVEHIAEHLYTKGQPDPELVIRTSGEQRIGGFLMWQSQHSEFYFCEAYWPAFRRVDFLRALRDFSLRERRLGR